LFSKIDNHSNDGFTLIEIIASIAILGMIIVIFLPIFPQIMQWTNQADDELVASNLLGKIAYDIKEDSSLYNSQPINECNLGEPFTKEFMENRFKVKLTLCKEETVELYRTNIKIYLNNKLLSQSYTYVGE
jgi:prepilin-type N-terminal cleavage/methylation domain-containing protein